MSQTSQDASAFGPADTELISAVRAGDRDAYGELYRRHADAARRLARHLGPASDADDLVADAFVKVFLVLQRGAGPDVAFRAYLLTAVRRLHVDRFRAGARVQPTDDLASVTPAVPFRDTAVEGFESSAAARAFATLPERWQMVLWHTEVEQQRPAEIAPLLGISPNSVSALAYRAREGLREAFLTAHVLPTDTDRCAWTRERLGAYLRGGLPQRERARVDDHLAECRRCAAVCLELAEVNDGLSGLLAPWLLGGAAAAYLGTTSGAGVSGVLGALTASVTSLGGRIRDAVAGHTATAAVGAAAVVTAVAGTTYLATHHGAPVADRSHATVGAPPPGPSTPTRTRAPRHDGPQTRSSSRRNTAGVLPTVVGTSTPPPSSPPATPGPGPGPATGPTQDPSGGPTHGSDGPTTTPEPPPTASSLDVSAHETTGAAAAHRVDATVVGLAAGSSATLTVTSDGHPVALDQRCLGGTTRGSCPVDSSPATYSFLVTPLPGQTVTVHFQVVPDGQGPRNGASTSITVHG